ncbi:SAM domain-containing protein [Bradyrhizobium japonicum]|uniref:SAM domain-containing protein n=1 Tax=Bradyrhizobium japonicum TaxID=375 RepID=UPI00339B7533
MGFWLRRLGLEQYEAAFRENEIDDTVLPNLTAEDLKDLGVPSSRATAFSVASEEYPVTHHSYS